MNLSMIRKNKSPILSQKESILLLFFSLLPSTTHFIVSAVLRARFLWETIQHLRWSYYDTFIKTDRTIFILSKKSIVSEAWIDSEN